MSEMRDLDAKLLAALEAAKGELVSRDDLVRAMWGEAALKHDGINSRLRNRVFQVRALLADGRRIEVVYNRGYRLLPAVVA